VAEAEACNVASINQLKTALEALSCDMEPESGESEEEQEAGTLPECKAVEEKCPEATWDQGF